MTIQTDILGNTDDIITREPLPASTKVYVCGTIYPDIKVPMREILLENDDKLRVYDTSGVYTDPTVDIDVAFGISQIRKEWIAKREVEEYDGRIVAPKDNGYNSEEQLEHATAGSDGLVRIPLRAKKGENVSQLYYARKGIITPEMEFVAIRENQDRAMSERYLSDEEREKRLKGHNFGANLPEEITPEFVRKEVAEGRAVIPC
ncbi:MAG TPA: phosphomethylpyrimidine synthase ThiC, partial [Campylobacterales bacterium]|nr:phosphomethylpyrimidine synthase ThiC [Campylobacterales bacterium]